MTDSLTDIKKEIDKIIVSSKQEQKNYHNNEKGENNLPLLQQKRMYMVIDSLSHLFNIFEEKEVLRFINTLSFSLKNNNILSIFTIDDTVIPSLS